jgi:pyruvate dehydrogenase E2 component (dihydrolipoamide acetyltransferase)
MTDVSTTIDDDRGESTSVRPYAMPSLGSDMDEGAVVEWLVGVGDTVERGQVVARVETEKSDIDIEIWYAGVVEEIVVPVNRVVPVGTTLMTVRATAGDRPEPGDEVAVDVTDAPPETPIAAQPPAVPTVSARGSTVRASPFARRLADERGVSLADVRGTGPGGAVRSRDLDHAVDVEADDADLRPAVSATTPSAPADEPSRADRMRLAIAQRMAQSNREIPHYRLERQVPLDALLARLSEHNADLDVGSRVLPAAAFVRAVAIAAARHREFNGTWVDDAFRPGEHVNVSVAVSLRSGGLVTPTIQDADQLSLDEVMAQMKEFTIAARAGRLRSQFTLSGSTITVTNLGERGADLVHGLISPPEVAIVGFGGIALRPWVVDGEVVARHGVTVTLGADHRATDGASGSRFLSTLADVLENPERL